MKLFIKNWECGWIAKILECPILIYGAPGSWKSYFAAYLAALRIVIKKHQVEINDPHLKLNKNEAWKDLLTVGVTSYGEGFNYSEVANRIDQYFDRIYKAEPNKPWVTTIFDEITNYRDQEALKDIGPKLIKSCLSDTRKCHESPILISHNNTAETLCGVKGMSQAKTEGLIQIHLYTTRDSEGNYVPLFRGTLKGLPDENGKFPDWAITLNPKIMNSSSILKFENESQEIQITPSQALGEPMRTIWRIAKESSGWVKVRDIQRRGLAVLKGNDALRIQQYLRILSDMGYGEIEESNNSVKFKAF